jgi:hypothetical protein
MGGWRERCDFAFAADPRSLASARIALGAALFADLVWRGVDLRAHYSEAGVLPRHMLERLSLHALSDGLALPAALFAVAALCSLALMVGFRTRWATALLWVLTLSLHNRNPLVTTGGDVLLRMLLLWGLFMPWNRVWALDGCRAGRRVGDDAASGASPLDSAHVGAHVGVAAWMVQVFLVHELAGLLKTGAEWRSDFSALYYALSIDQLQLPLGGLLLRAPEIVLQGLTAAVVWGEMLLPPLLFGSFFLPRRLWLPARCCALGALVGLHLGLLATLALGIFPWVNLASLLVFVPGAVWQRSGGLIRRIERGAAAASGWLERLLPGIGLWAGRPTGNLPSPARWAVVGLLAYVVWQNASSIAPVLRPPASLSKLIAPLKIHQEWDLFAPRPYRNDGWFVVVGHRSPAPPIDLLRRGASVSVGRPDDISAEFPTFRWRKYLWNLSLERHERYREPFLATLCRGWNHRHAADERVQMAQFIFVREWTRPPGQAPLTERLTLGMASCAPLLEEVHLARRDRALRANQVRAGCSVCIA